MRMILAFLLTICCFTAPVRAQEGEKPIVPSAPDFADTVMTGEAQVEAVIDPLHVRLQDGRIIQLAGVEIPDLTPYDTGDIGAAALDSLRSLLERKWVKVYQSRDARNARTNRMGYHLAHLVEKSGEVWVQGLLLANGMARVRPSSVNTELAVPMLALEQEAREGARGLWSDPAYAVLTPDTAAQGANGWAVVEGEVRAAAMAGNTLYLNFGPDWRNDFTIGLPAAQRRAFSKLNTDPMQFAHRTVRVHGWLESRNGPYIELIDPVWLEVLPQAEAEGAQR